jgi:hypothetical protein
MRSDREFAAEALGRAALLRERRKRGRARLTAGGALAACLALAGFVAVFSGAYPGAGGPAPVAAAEQAPLMFPGAGGYVLCGVICFAAGVAVTLLCQRKRRHDGV